MKERPSTLVIAFLAFVLVALVLVVGRDTQVAAETLAGAFLGTITGAVIIFGLQLRMEQTRFFQLLLAEIKEIHSSFTAWQRIPNSDEWRCCEFRKAVGLASWIHDPVGDDGARHRTLDIGEVRERYPGVEWDGVVYSVDQNFCVASKPLHDYANWYNLVLDGLESHLLSAKQMRMLWRSLADNFFIVDEKKPDESVGMRNWTEFFVFGSEAESSPRYRLHKKMLNEIWSYTPAKIHRENRLRSIHSNNI